MPADTAGKLYMILMPFPVSWVCRGIYEVGRRATYTGTGDASATRTKKFLRDLGSDWSVLA